jgi:hypothetical protein
MVLKNVQIQNMSRFWGEYWKIKYSDLKIVNLKKAQIWKWFIYKNGSNLNNGLNSKTNSKMVQILKWFKFELKIENGSN